MSTNITVACFRSALSLTSGKPQELQKRAVGESLWPHWGHATNKPVPQLSQKLLPGRFSVWHAWHSIGLLSHDNSPYHLIESVSYIECRIWALTDNGTHFTDPKGNGLRVAEDIQEPNSLRARRQMLDAQTKKFQFKSKPSLRGTKHLIPNAG
jgi:hypothetical protein